MEVLTSCTIGRGRSLFRNELNMTVDDFSREICLDDHEDKGCYIFNSTNATAQTAMTSWQA